MDDFRFYNRVLTDTEIASVYSSDALVDTTALKVRFNFDAAPGKGLGVSWSPDVSVPQSGAGVSGPSPGSDFWPHTTAHRADRRRAVLPRQIALAAAQLKVSKSQRETGGDPGLVLCTVSS